MHGIDEKFLIPEWLAAVGTVANKYEVPITASLLYHFGLLSICVGNSPFTPAPFLPCWESAWFHKVADYTRKGVPNHINLAFSVDDSTSNNLQYMMEPLAPITSNEVLRRYEGFMRQQEELHDLLDYQSKPQVVAAYACTSALRYGRHTVVKARDAVESFCIDKKRERELKPALKLVESTATTILEHVLSHRTGASEYLDELRDAYALLAASRCDEVDDTPCFGLA